MNKNSSKTKKAALFVKEGIQNSTDFSFLGIVHVYVLNTNLFADFSPNIYTGTGSIFDLEFRVPTFFESKLFWTSNFDALGIRIFDMTVITRSTV